MSPESYRGGRGEPRFEPRFTMNHTFVKSRKETFFRFLWHWAGVRLTSKKSWKKKLISIFTITDKIIASRHLVSFLSKSTMISIATQAIFERVSGGKFSRCKSMVGVGFNGLWFFLCCVTVSTVLRKKICIALWSSTTKNRNVSTRLLTRLFAYSLAPLTLSLAPLTHSLVRSAALIGALTHFIGILVIKCWYIRLF